MKFQTLFSGKNKINIDKLPSTEIAQRVQILFSRKTKILINNFSSAVLAQRVVMVNL